jgi:hypothetical protein
MATHADAMDPNQVAAVEQEAGKHFKDPTERYMAGFGLVGEHEQWPYMSAGLKLADEAFAGARAAYDKGEPKVAATLLDAGHSHIVDGYRTTFHPEKDKMIVHGEPIGKKDGEPVTIALNHNQFAQWLDNPQNYSSHAIMSAPGEFLNSLKTAEVGPTRESMGFAPAQGQSEPEKIRSGIASGAVGGEPVSVPNTEINKYPVPPHAAPDEAGPTAPQGPLPVGSRNESGISPDVQGPGLVPGTSLPRDTNVPEPQAPGAGQASADGTLPGGVRPYNRSDYLAPNASRMSYTNPAAVAKGAEPAYRYETNVGRNYQPLSDHHGGVDVGMQAKEDIAAGHDKVREEIAQIRGQLRQGVKPEQIAAQLFRDKIKNADHPLSDEEQDALWERSLNQVKDSMNEGKPQGATQQKPTQQAGPPINVRTADDYAKLQPGQKYIAPDGSTRTKR